MLFLRAATRALVKEIPKTTHVLFKPNRHFSTNDHTTTSTERAATTLNESLRKLYLKVHPDFFTQWPEAKDINEQSFQELMSFLDELEEMEETHDFASSGQLYPLVFYLKDGPTPEHNEEIVGLTGLKKITIILKSGKDDERTLAKLFDLCGVEHQLHLDPSKLSSIRKSKQWKDELSFAHFAKKVHKTAREKSEQRLKLERELDMERTIFFVQHQIRIVADLPEEMGANWKMRVDTERMLLNRLEKVLRTLHFERQLDLEVLGSTTISFGNKQGIDPLGRVCLKIMASNEEWVEDLYNVDREKIDTIRDGSGDRYDREKIVGSTIGISYFYTDYTLGASLRYAKYLGTLVAEAKQKRIVFKGTETLKVRLLDTTEPFDSKLLDDLIKTDPALCAVSFPINVPPTVIFDWIEQYGAGLVQQYNSLNWELESMNALILTTKRKFRLRSLTRTSNVTDEQLRKCCTTIIRYASTLTHWLEHQRIKVAQDYDLDESDGTIIVKWDFII